MKSVQDPDAAANTGTYSPALVFGDFVMVSGQGPITPQGEIVNGSVAEETRMTLENVKKLLEASGSNMSQVVKCTCYLADIKDFDEFDAVYREFFNAPYPARSTVEAGLKGIKVEIDAMAYTGS